MTDADTSDPSLSRATRCWTLYGDRGTLDVELTARDDETLGDVVPRVAALLGVPVEGLWIGSSRLPDELALSAPELAHGMLLGLGRPSPRSVRTQRSSALELHVVGGPAAGRTVPLGQGRHVLGRGSEAGVRLDDPDVSRRHAVVHVGSGQISVADLGSTNGTRLADEELGEQSRPWPAGVLLRLGASTLTVTGPGAPAAALEGAAGGRVRLRPTRRMSTPSAESEIVFPRPPATPPRRRLAWVAVALPAVGGVLMAWLLNAPTFLFFALLSPVVALGTWLSEGWSGRRSSRRDAAAHAVAILAAQTSVEEAVRADVRAVEAAHPDLAALTTAARRRTHLLWGRTAADPDALTVRVGTGAGTTHVTRVESDGARRRVAAEHLPVPVDLRDGGGLAVVGPRERALGVLRSVLTQVTALHPPGDVDLLLLSTADRLPDWAWARWLPHLEPRSVHVDFAVGAGEAQREDDDLHAWLSSVVARRRAAAGGRPDSPATETRPTWLVVLVDRPLDPRTAAMLRSGRNAGVLLLTVADSTEELPVTVDAAVRLAGETGDRAVLHRHGLADHSSVIVDRLPRSAAADFARDLAALTPVTSSSALPRSVRLVDLPADGLRLAGEDTTGSWSRSRERLVATLGRAASGPVEIDLCRQGPHALIAGTTGSGKSELLQTLIAGLALRHPPDRCSFLLVDYKGGAAFAEAAALPHTVGLVTDLDGQTTARALRSLTAELTRREAILSEHRVADIAGLPDEVDLARLVIVVDEFATLAEELPSFVPGLVGIAQRGRSLGVHLLLATQRPGGVVSPEIRANCTLRICLRTTDEADSRDVLGTPQAALLPVDLPGRAYLRAGSGDPTALQVARVATSSPPAAESGPHVRRWTWPPLSGGPVAPDEVDKETDLARLVRAVGRYAGTSGTAAPHRPWRPPLPDRLAPSPSSEGPGEPSPTLLRIGLVDRPDSQSQEPLELDLAEGGTWLAVGGARSGRTTLLRTVLGEAVHRLGPDRLNVHLIEAGAGPLAADVAALPHAGTVVSADDAHRTVRLMDRLAQEVAARRTGARSEDAPLVLLLIDGIETISTLLDEADPSRGSAGLLRLLRDGSAVGLTAVVTADRAVPGGRLAAVARQRLVLPLPDRADYAIAGISARDVPNHRPQGRALLGEEALECQLALPRPLEKPPASPSARRASLGVLRIVELPPDPAVGLPHSDSGVGSEATLALPVGPGGDEGGVLVVDLMRTAGLLVTGPPGSGRTSALDAFARHLVAAGSRVLRVGGRGGPRGAEGGDSDAVWLDAHDCAGVNEWLADLNGRPGVVIADDLGAPGDTPALAGLAAPNSPRAALVAAGSPGQMSGHFQGPVASLRRARTGLLLCPGPGDADLLGIRLPRTPVPTRPGSGWLVIGGVVDRVQVARRRLSTDRAAG